MPSFDVVSQVDLQEIDNAMNQAKKEIANRYDFKGHLAEIDIEDKKITIKASDKMKLEAITEILRQKMSKRGISPKALKFEEAEKATGDSLRQVVIVQEGISTEQGKKIVKLIKDQNLKKIQAQIQGEQVRITGPKRDDLQAVIAILKEKVDDMSLQYVNFRD
jgi:uncharacterized protein YajQ (UPF0234 family)